MLIGHLSSERDPLSVIKRLSIKDCADHLRWSWQCNLRWHNFDLNEYTMKHRKQETSDLPLPGASL